jgi:hypothetical protein
LGGVAKLVHMAQRVVMATKCVLIAPLFALKPNNV